MASHTGILKAIGLLTALLHVFLTQGQQWTPSALDPSEAYDNVRAEVIYSDSQATCFVIWIRKDVKAHYHAHHTEQITVVSGKGEMRLGDKVFLIRKGDWVVIPKGTVHAVRVLSKRPLKVISVQSPHFDGTDRIVVDG